MGDTLVEAQPRRADRPHRGLPKDLGVDLCGQPRPISFRALGSADRLAKSEMVGNWRSTVCGAQRDRDDLARAFLIEECPTTLEHGGRHHDARRCSNRGAIDRNRSCSPVTQKSRTLRSAPIQDAAMAGAAGAELGRCLHFVGHGMGGAPVVSAIARVTRWFASGLRVAYVGVAQRAKPPVLSRCGDGSRHWTRE